MLWGNYEQSKSFLLPLLQSLLQSCSCSSCSSSSLLDKSRVSYSLNVTATDNGRCCGGTTRRASRSACHCSSPCSCSSCSSSSSLDKSRVSYSLNVTATDNGRCCGGTTSRASRSVVIFDVKDINNNSPRFTDCSSYNPTVLENDNVGSLVIQVQHCPLQSSFLLFHWRQCTFVTSV